MNLGDAIASVLSGVRVVPDDVADALERRERAALVRSTWERVPVGAHQRAARPEFVRAVDTWQPGQPLVLLGPTGSGKTAAAAQLVARLCRDAKGRGGDALVLARSTLWVRADELTAAGGAERDTSATKLLLRAQQCRLLVLDDLATSSKTLLRILQFRYDAKRASVVTSGVRSAAEFASAIGGQAPVRWILDGGIHPGKVAVA